MKASVRYIQSAFLKSTPSTSWYDVRQQAELRWVTRLFIVITSDLYNVRRSRWVQCMYRHKCARFILPKLSCL